MFGINKVRFLRAPVHHKESSANLILAATHFDQSLAENEIDNVFKLKKRGIRPLNKTVIKFLLSKFIILIRHFHPTPQEDIELRKYQWQRMPFPSVKYMFRKLKSCLGISY